MSGATAGPGRALRVAASTAAEAREKKAAGRGCIDGSDCAGDAALSGQDGTGAAELVGKGVLERGLGRD